MNDFASLLEEQIPRLRRYARALTHDVTRADDLVQSCLTRAITFYYFGSKELHSRGGASVTFPLVPSVAPRL